MNQFKSTQQKQNDLILAGYQSYQSHQYTQALKYYTLSLNQNKGSNTKNTIQTTIGIIHIHLCNYQEAYTILYELSNTIKPNNLQNAVILIKIYASLALISVINANSQSAKNQIEVCLDLVKKFEQQQQLLFKMIMQMLYGYQSFREMQSITNTLVSDQSLYGNGVMCSSMAMNRQLCGHNLQISYRLQNKALQIFKSKKDPIMMILSYRHLLHLSTQMGLAKNVSEIYSKQLNNILKNNAQVSGISETTLFRNYEEKIKIATQITKLLLYFQNQKLNKGFENKNQQCWKKRAVLNKLKRLKLRSNNENIDTINKTIDLVGQNKDSVIEIMQSFQKSQFLRQAIYQYKNAAQTFVNTSEIIGKKIKLQFWNLLIQNLSAKQSINNNYNRQFQFQQKKDKVQKLNRANQRKTQKSPLSQTHQHSKQAKINSKQSTLKRKYVNQIKISPNNLEQKKIVNEVKSGVRQTNEIISILKKKRNNQSNEDSQSGKNSKVSFQVNPKIQSKFTEQFKKSSLNNRLNQFRTNNPLNIEFQPDHNQKEPSKEKIHSQLNSKQVQIQIIPPQVERQPAFIMHKNNQIIEPILTHKQPIINKIDKSQLGENLIKKYLKKCHFGQYIMKKHYSSDGGEQKFLIVTKTHIKWASDESKIQTKYQQYLLKDIRGLVFGKVTDTFLKQCNQNLEPWKCFSLILQKRTLDFYCSQEKDVQFWVPGIRKAICEYNKLVPFTVGQLLWRRMLLKLRYYFVDHLKGHQRKFSNANAFSIIQFGMANMHISSKLKKHK